jgi:predicted PurR-regulated permease PerM
MGIIMNNILTVLISYILYFLLALMLFLAIFQFLKRKTMKKILFKSILNASLALFFIVIFFIILIVKINQDNLINSNLTKMSYFISDYNYMLSEWENTNNDPLYTFYFDSSSLEYETEALNFSQYFYENYSGLLNMYFVSDNNYNYPNVPQPSSNFHFELTAESMNIYNLPQSQNSVENYNNAHQDFNELVEQYDNKFTSIVIYNDIEYLTYSFSPQIGINYPLWYSTIIFGLPSFALSLVVIIYYKKTRQKK